MEKRSVKVGLIQMTCSDDKQANIDHVIREIKNASISGAQIICLQELFSSRYFCQEENYDHFTLAEKIPGPTTKTIQELSKENNVVIIASQFEKRAQGVYHNTVAIVDADG